MTELHSSQLQFSRDGRRLVVGERNRVVIIDLANDETRRELEIEGVEAVVAFADQLWAKTVAGALHRWTLEGRELDEDPQTLEPGGSLVPTTVGGPSALWT